MTADDVTYYGRKRRKTAGQSENEGGSGHKNSVAEGAAEATVAGPAVAETAAVAVHLVEAKAVGKGIKRPLDLNETDESDDETKVSEGGDPMEASLPESTRSDHAMGNVCLCEGSEKFYANLSGKRKIYCGAVDGQNVKCNNLVRIRSNSTALVRRPRASVPFMFLCDLHTHLFKLHICCVTCGRFCIQGTHLYCEKNHLFHDGCGINMNGLQGCPHCGIAETKRVTLVPLNPELPVYHPHNNIEQPNGPNANQLAILFDLPSGRRVNATELRKMVALLCRKADAEALAKLTLRDFRDATIEGNFAVFTKCLYVGLNPYHTFPEFHRGNAMHVSSVKGNLLFVHLLREVGVNVNCRDEERYSPLMRAVSNERVGIVKYLVTSGANVNLRNKEGQMALHMAAQVGNLKICRFLLSTPNRPMDYTDGIDRMGRTALMWATEKNHVQVVRYLLKMRAKCTILDREMNTALHWAAYSRDVEIVRILLDNGADINSVNSCGDTPLHLAARKDKYEMMLLLLKGGAHLDIRNSAGMLPIDCCQSDTSKCITILKSPIVVKERNCARREFMSVYKYLRKMCDSNSKTYEVENTALHLATCFKNVELVSMLLDHGSDVNSVNSDGDTPLHLAARKGIYDIVFLLLMRGANAQIRNAEGLLPIDCCTCECITIFKSLTKLKEKPRFSQIRLIRADVSKGREDSPIQCFNAVDDEPLPEFAYVKDNVNRYRFRGGGDFARCDCSRSCAGGSCMCCALGKKCWYKEGGILKDDFDYEVTATIFECGNSCKCDRRLCVNRVVQRGIGVALSLIRTKDKTWSVTALQTIRKGTFVCEYVGEFISYLQAITKDVSYLFHVSGLDTIPYFICSQKYGNISRYLKRSKSPNLTSVAVYVEKQSLSFPRIAFFANRDINRGEELA